MKIKTGDAIAYKDPHAATLYGVGVVTSVTDEEYTVLWAQRGSKRYKRSILDEKVTDVFRRETARGDRPRERHLQLGASKDGISFNENYNRAKVELLCQTLRKSRAKSAKNVADGLTGEMFTRKLVLRATARTVLWQLAELCDTQTLDEVADAARQISHELFFGYVIQKSDFKQH